ncbi:MAG: redoxin [Acidobacteria bacterium]|nr:MAG: redoxin [Acidobacteriota bacterium]
MMAGRRNGIGKERFLWVLALILSVSAASCRGTRRGQSQVRRYHLKGAVVQVDKSQQHLLINHEQIPGSMAAMTMPYPVADPRTLEQLSPGDQITADVVVSPSEIHLENVLVVKKSDGKTLPPRALLKPSDQAAAVPDFTLVNQDGKRIRQEQYRGKALLLTFIYTRCPLPDYCPLMTHNFAEIEKALMEWPELYTKTHLLSISFDSQHDTPPVLRNYARAFVTDRGPHTFEHWEFATVPAAEKSTVTKFFDVFVTEEQGQITHSLSTAILSPEGRFYKGYNGNDWRPADAVADLSSCTASEPSEAISQSLQR